MCRRRACMRRAGGVAAGRVLAAQPATRDCNHSGHQRLSKNKMLPRADTSHRLAPVHAAANTTAHTHCPPGGTQMRGRRRGCEKRCGAVGGRGRLHTPCACLCAEPLRVHCCGDARPRARPRARADTRAHHQLLPPAPLPCSPLRPSQAQQHARARPPEAAQDAAQRPGLRRIEGMYGVRCAHAHDC